jgi:hypothetical protein
MEKGESDDEDEDEGQADQITNSVVLDETYNHAFRLLSMYQTFSSIRHGPWKMKSSHVCLACVEHSADVSHKGEEGGQM